MELRHLRAFIAVAEELSFRRAAERLCMTQPPLSQSIKALEEEIGAQLFERGRKKGVRLTSAGETFLPAATRILLDIERAKKNAGDPEGAEIGSLTIGYTDDFTYGALPDLLNDFSSRHPGVSLHFFPGASFRLAYQLNRSDADCIFTTQPLHAVLANAELLSWRPTPIVALVPADHKLARRKRINLVELADDRFLMTPHANRSPFDTQTSKLFVNAGFTPKSSIEPLGAELAIELVRRRHGVTLIGRESIPENPQGVAPLSLTDRQAQLGRALAWRGDNANPILAAFIAEARKHVGAD